MFYNITLSEYGKGKIFVSPQFYMKYLNGSIHSTTIHAGLRKKKASVVTMAKLRENEVKITGDILEALSIPLDILYQVRLQANEIYLGPVIGLLLAQRFSFLTGNRLRKLSEYALEYNRTHGLLYVFSSDGIDFESKTAKGFYYKPDGDGSGLNWKKAVLPLPDSIFRRVTLSSRQLGRLKEITNNRLFNSYYFDKWEFWNMASRYPEIKANIPNTRLFRNFEDVEEMLSMHGSIFLKPINGSLGKGLVKISKEKDTYTFQRKFDVQPKSIYSRGQAAEYISDTVSDRRYLIQQDIHLLKYKGEYVDFRINMQKDNSMKWQCTAIIACTGLRGGIHSNYTGEGTYLRFEDFMAQSLHLDVAAISRKKQDIIELCMNVCSMLDKTGENYGDLGIDVGFDADLKSWVFEVNKRQFHYLPLMVGDNEGYYAAKTNPVMYAAALCGFQKN